MKAFEYFKLLLFLSCVVLLARLPLHAANTILAGSGDHEVVTAALDTIFLNYSNKISLPKTFRNTQLSIHHVENKKAMLRVFRKNDALTIDQIVEEGYYFLELKNKKNVTVFQQLLLAKKMSNPRFLLNRDTVAASYNKVDLLKNFEAGLFFAEQEAAALSSLVSFDLIVVPFKQEPQQTRLTRATNFMSSRKTELLNLLNHDSRVFVSDIIVQFSNEKEPRNIGSVFFVVLDSR